MDSFGRLSEIDDGQWPLVWQYDKCGRITQEHQGFIGVIKAPKTRTNGLRQAKQNKTPLGWVYKIIMKKIYLLRSTSKNTCSFIQNYPNGEQGIKGRAMDQRWKPFGDDYQPIRLELGRSDSGKKNYQFDFSGFSKPFFVISESALRALADILEPRGQLLPVITESKRKQFFGYYPTNPLPGCFDKEKSVYEEWPNGLIIRKLFLIAQNITDEYLFSIEEDIGFVFVTDKFKQRVEDANLLGFDFSTEISIS